MLYRWIGAAIVNIKGYDYRRLFLLALLAGLTGCASLSEDQCVTGDWYGIGYSDGLQGRTEASLANHQEACAEYTITLNVDAYLQGREEGIALYCQPDNGYRLGRNGSQYNYVCPQHLAPRFLETYQQGRKVYLQEKQVQALEDEVELKTKEATAFAARIDHTEKRLVSEGSSSVERQKLLFKLRELEREQRFTKRELNELEHRLIREKAHLFDLE